MDAVTARINKAALYSYEYRVKTDHGSDTILKTDNTVQNCSKSGARYVEEM
jgi:hypothetical protein